MKLMCTACQQWLQVGDEFAGQRMKCPLCNNVFSVPALPADAEMTLSPTAHQPPPAPQDPSGSPQPSAGGSTPMFTGNQDSPSSSTTSGGSDVYKVTDEPRPAPASSPQTSVPPPLPQSSVPRSTPRPTTTPTAEGYTTTASFSIKPEILQWVPVACMGVVFVLTIFAWVRFAPGGQDVVTQNAWQAAIGSVSVDNDLKDAADVVKGSHDRDKKVDVGASYLAIFYVLFFVGAFLLSVGVTVLAAMPHLANQLPPQLKQVLPWRWAILSAALAVPLFFLGLQSVAGFVLEDQVKANAKKQLNDRGNYDSLNTENKKHYDMEYGLAATSVYQTWWVRLALALHVVALLAAGLMFWYTQRGDSRPLPRLQLQW